MKKIIPLTTPPITSYPAIANILSMMWSRKDMIMPWLCDHFIQLVVRPNHKYTFGDFYDHADIDNYICTIFTLPGLDWMRTNSETANFNIFTEYIEYQINNNYCLEPCLDRFYFKFSEEYNRNHYIHSTFIYGYDSDLQEIYIADFFSNGRYEHKIVSYNEINRSMNNAAIINLYKAYDDKYNFNEQLMRKFFEDYLCSKDSFSRFESSSKEYNQGVLFGLKYYDYLLEKYNKNDLYDTRLFHVLLDHKTLMKYRLEYLLSLDKFDFKEVNALIDKNNKLIKDSMILRNCVLKYHLKPSVHAYERLETRINDLKKNDHDFVIDILSMLNKTRNMHK